jgi:hypothetical protein
LRLIIGVLDAQVAVVVRFTGIIVRVGIMWIAVWGFGAGLPSFVTV